MFEVGNWDLRPSAGTMSRQKSVRAGDCEKVNSVGKIIHSMIIHVPDQTFRIDLVSNEQVVLDFECCIGNCPIRGAWTTFAGVREVDLWREPLHAK